MMSISASYRHWPCTVANGKQLRKKSPPKPPCKSGRMPRSTFSAWSATGLRPCTPSLRRVLANRAHPPVWRRRQDTRITSHPSCIRSYRTRISLARLPSRHPQPHRTSTRTLTSAPRSHHTRMRRPSLQPFTRHSRPIPPRRPVARLPASHHSPMRPRPFPSRINLPHLCQRLPSQARIHKARLQTPIIRNSPSSIRFITHSRPLSPLLRPSTPRHLCAFTPLPPHYHRPSPSLRAFPPRPCRLPRRRRHRHLRRHPRQHPCPHLHPPLLSTVCRRLIRHRLRRPLHRALCLALRRRTAPNRKRLFL